jgi:hypothetical protein
VAVSSCAFLAVIDPPSATAPGSAQGFAHSVATPANPNTVSVFTYQASNNNPANRPFTLAVLC